MVGGRCHNVSLPGQPGTSTICVLFIQLMAIYQSHVDKRKHCRGCRNIEPKCVFNYYTNNEGLEEIEEEEEVQDIEI